MADTLIGRIRKGKTSVIGQAGLILVLAALVITTCGPGTRVPQTPSAEEREPFSARRESEDGAIVAWSGYTEGYQPGTDAEFDITITNETGQTWYGRYCLQLLDREMPQVVASLEERAFTLEPGVGFSDVVSVQFPDGLDAGAYGLSLAVRRSGGPMVDLVPIQIGETDEVRPAATQRDMDASLDACPAVVEAGEGHESLVDLSKADLAERLGIGTSEITVQSVEPTEFPDASLGVPEPGTSYAQVVTPGYIVRLAAQGNTYTYHAADDRVVLVPASTTPRAEGQGEIEIPEAGARVTLPLHFLAHVGQPMEAVTATLRWQDGTELSQSFTALGGDGTRGLLIGSLDWRAESTPPQPETQRATLTLQSESGATVAEQTVTVLSADDPETERIDLYWLLGEALETEQRRIVRTASIEAAALEELLWGPPPQNLAGFRTAIPTPEEVLAYPGRGPEWGNRVRLQGLTIENGMARADFSAEMQAYGGGSARVLAIREQITRTLKQFPSVQEVILAVAGETEGVLQP